MIGIFILLSSIKSFAGSGSVSGKIEFIQVSVFGGAGEAVLIKFATPPSGQPDCANDDRMIVSLESDVGQSILSMALAAKFAQTDVFVGGNGDCLNSHEKIRYMRVL